MRCSFWSHTNNLKCHRSADQWTFHRTQRSEQMTVCAVSSRDWWLLKTSKVTKIEGVHLSVPRQKTLRNSKSHWMLPGNGTTVSLLQLSRQKSLGHLGVAGATFGLAFDQGLWPSREGMRMTKVVDFFRVRMWPNGPLEKNVIYGRSIASKQWVKVQASSTSKVEWTATAIFFPWGFVYKIDCSVELLQMLS